MTNEELSRKLRSHAAELAHAGDNLYRIRAFRQAAFAVLRLAQPAEDLLHQFGRAELARRAGIGASIAETLEEWIHEMDSHIPTTDMCACAME
ncbi:MAG: hypothetical protein LC104_02725 [Bacteroidales bacterium]|nr:hypothetical protein [Bacteroidales bacterium]